MIAIIDYGMGNLRSVEKGLEKVGVQVKVTSEPEIISKARGIVLPGVGAFAKCLNNLKKRGLISLLKNLIFSNKPFLGICLGFQLLFEESEENGLTKGLGIIKGKVVRLPSFVKVPHMGWNQIKVIKKIPIFTDIPNSSFFYFAHSYYGKTQSDKVVAAKTQYGIEFPSSVCQDNLIGVQFHPEKSSYFGLKLLENFGRMCR